MMGSNYQRLRQRDVIICVGFHLLKPMMESNYQRLRQRDVIIYVGFHLLRPMMGSNYQNPIGVGDGRAGGQEGARAPPLKFGKIFFGQLLC